jgi:hypothetical protein
MGDPEGKENRSLTTRATTEEHKEPTIIQTAQKGTSCSHQPERVRQERVFSQVAVWHSPTSHDAGPGTRIACGLILWDAPR